MSQVVDRQFRTRLRLRVGGTVQGVGFRPFVYRLARELGLVGWVENTAQGMTVEVEGSGERLVEFRSRLESEKPRQATIHQIESTARPPRGETAFTIRTSRDTGTISALVLPDLATCADCLRDIFDETNRRFRYPFTNCTNCGPRFSIVERLPYDRRHTSMKRFALCEACRREYEDPSDRRFHAQPNACAYCGPTLELWDEHGRARRRGDDALRDAVAMIRAGRILAIKGLGGFQLVVDARRADAVAELRHRKHRKEKPFAVMVPSLGDAESLCRVTDEERESLRSTEAPIVLLRRHRGASMIAESVAPGLPRLGVMLPYTPLHHLLMADLKFPVVATSGNLSDEPICIDEHEALDRMGGVADAFLVHDRPIVRPVDDSVVQVVAGSATVVRRARGYAPLPLEVADLDRSVLALGAHQKNTVAFATRGHVFLSQHLGDLVTREALEAFDRATKDLPSLYESEPTVVACDLHPDYASSCRAETLGTNVVRVQHHHAHVVSCMAEHDLDGIVLGVAWDGTGYGVDGSIWGGEFLRCSRRTFERVAHLRPFRLPGGERAAREPRRCALGLLYEVFGDAAFVLDDLPALRAFTEWEKRALRTVLRRKVHCPTTTSMGRLFDAVASIAGVRQLVDDEGRAAMEWEFAAETTSDRTAYPFDGYRARSAERGTTPASGKGRTATWPMVIDWEPLVRAMLDDLRANQPVAVMARRFHLMLVDVILWVAREMGERRMVLSGGCFQNRLLLETAIERLRGAGFQPFWHQRVPTNDGGISLGQVVVAQALGSESSSCV